MTASLHIRRSFAPATYLSGMKNNVLKALCAMTGVQSTGTKSQLVERLTDMLLKPRLPWERKGVKPTAQGKPLSQTRFVSADMGIKNFAYCVVNVTRHDHTPGSPHMLMEIVDWKCLDLMQSQSVNIADDNVKQPPDVTAFDPANMAPKAYELVNGYLLHHKPQTVLIERQRHRSHAGPAVQEWTIRVNSLEHMLWAALETLRRRKYETLQTWSVLPNAVNRFWLEGNAFQLQGMTSQQDGPASTTPERALAKTEKIDLVKLMLTKAKASDERTWHKFAAQQEENLSLRIGLLAPVTNIGEAFVERKKARKSGAESESGRLDLMAFKKRDDLADCFLQAAAWVCWEQNRIRLKSLIKHGVSAEEILPAMQNYTHKSTETTDAESAIAELM